MRFEPIVIASGTVMATTATSTGVYIDQIVAYAIQAAWTGSPVGTMAIQVSNDIVKINPTLSDPAVNVSNWTTYSGSPQTLTGSGTSGNFLWNASVAGYSWVRLLYTASSGMGTLTATFTGKG